MPDVSTLDKVLLSFPSLLSLADEADEKAPRSWIQLARTGSFKSKRYGDFSITKTDLAEMLYNFKNVTPKAPTELPVDFDHLSMDPKKPMDGVAAGWFKNLALREDDCELWGEVEWTPRAAEAIRNKEYRFVSPSFVKNHVHKDGTKLGTVLLASAITNHPFLEGMASLCLYNFSTMGDLALVDDRAINLKKEHSAKWHRCVEHVTARGGVDSPEAVCTAVLGEETFVEAMSDDEMDRRIDAYYTAKNLNVKKEVINLPFAEYTDFEDCVSKNGDKDDPKAFCGWLKHKIEGRREKVDLVALGAEWKQSREATVLHLAEIGQRIMIAPGNARTQDEVGATFEIAEVVGEGDDAFVSLKDMNGMIHKWFRATELLPASSVPANPQHPPLQPGAGPTVPAQVPMVGVPGQQGVPPANPLAPGMPGAAAVPGQVPGTVPGAMPGAAPVADPAAAAAAAVAAGADPKQAADAAVKAAGAPAAPPPDDTKVGNEKDTTKSKQKEGATGGEAVVAEKAAAAEAAAADAAGLVPSAEKKEVPPALEKARKKSDTGELEDEDEIAMAIRKAVAAALAAGQTPMRGMNMKFELTNDKNEKFEVTAEQLAAAGVKILPEGAVAVNQTELDGLKGQVTNLSERLDASEKNGTKREFDTEILRLKSGALIDGKQEAFARKQWENSTDLTAFREWAATFTNPILTLGKEHGSGGKPEGEKSAGEQATEKIISLSASIARERGISLAEATKMASSQLADEADTYREQFAEV